MDILTSNSALLLEKSVGFLWTKQAAILDNIANAETPNYKAKVVTFEESIRSRLERAAASPGEAEESVRETWPRRAMRSPCSRPRSRHAWTTTE